MDVFTYFVHMILNMYKIIFKTISFLKRGLKGFPDNVFNRLHIHKFTRVFRLFRHSILLLIVSSTNLLFLLSHKAKLTSSSAFKGGWFSCWWGRSDSNRRPFPGTAHLRSYGFLTAPEALHSTYFMVSKPVYFYSGARRHSSPAAYRLVSRG